MIEQVKKPLSENAAEAVGPDAFWEQKMQCPGFLCLLLTLATLWVFSSVAHYDFVNYDDPDYVTANVHVQRGLTWERLLKLQRRHLGAECRAVGREEAFPCLRGDLCVSTVRSQVIIANSFTGLRKL